MPTYTIAAPDGRTLKIEGPTPPSEAELDEIFTKVGAGVAPSMPTAESAATAPAAMTVGGRQVRPELAAQITDIRQREQERTQIGRDVFTGVLKGAGQTAINLGKIVHAVPGFSEGLDALYGTPGLSRSALTEADRMLAPSSGAQQVGKFAEQAAEVVVPAGAVRRAGVAAATRAAPALSRVMGQSAANVLPRAAVEATGAAGMALAQGADPTTGAVLGGAVPVVGQALEALPASLKASAAKNVVQALGPTKERFKAIANRLTPEILKRGLGGSRQALQQRAAETLETVGEQLDDALKLYGAKRIGTQPIVEALEAAKDAFRTTTQVPVAQLATQGRAAQATSIADGMATVMVEFEPRAIRQLNGLQKIIGDLGENATVDQLTAVRRAWDKVVSQAGGYAQRAGGAIGVPLKDQSEAFAKREGSGAIRKLLASEVPDLAAINKEYSFWKNLDDVLTQTLQRTQPHGPGLLRQGAEAAGQVVGGLAGSPGGTASTIGGAYVLGKLAKGLQSAISSPRWKFVSANLRNTLADSMMKGNTSAVSGVLARIAAVEGAKVPGALAAGSLP